jgi:hypothetical protein
MAAALIHLALLAWTALAWTAGGYRLCPRRLRLGDPLAVAATALAVGAGITALLLTVAGAFGVLRPPLVLAIQLGWTGIGAAGAGELARRLAGARRVRAARPRRWLALALAAVVAVVGGAALLATLAPPTSIDATVYHLRVAREFLRAGRLVLLPDDARTFQPLYVQMLFAAGMSLGGDVLSALVHWLLGAGAVVAAAAWARRLGSRWPWVAAALFAATPLVVWESASSFIDLGLALFTAVGLYWATRPDDGRPALLLATLMAGLAAGSKFTGCGALALVGLGAAWSVRRRPRRALARLALVSLGGLAVASPWYARNALATGNPIYPLGNRLLGIPESVSKLSVWHYGHGSDPLHLLTSPFDLLWRGDAFDSGWSIGPAFLALLPPALLARNRSALAAPMAALIGLYWIFWFYSSPQVRLLLPVLPVAAGLAAVGLEAALASGWLARGAGLATLLVSLAVGLGTAIISAKGSANVVAGRETRQAFLGRMSWDYPAFEQVNRRLGRDARLAVLGISHVYYLDPPVTQVYRDDLQELRRAGFTHLLRVRFCSDGPFPDAPAVLWQGEYLRRGSRFQRLYGDSRGCAQLLALSPPPRDMMMRP